MSKKYSRRSRRSRLIATCRLLGYTFERTVFKGILRVNSPQDESWSIQKNQLVLFLKHRLAKDGIIINEPEKCKKTINPTLQ